MDEPRKRKSTMVELVKELEQAAIAAPTEQIGAIAEMIHEARTGEYHDYKNQKYVCGKVALVEKLTAAGLDRLADRVKAGEFDETENPEGPGPDDGEGPAA